MYNESIMKYLKLKQLDLINSKPLKFCDKDVRLRDLKLIIKLAEKFKFYKNNNLITDDVIILNPSCENNYINIFYDDEFEKLSDEQKTIKVISELYIYISGRFMLSENNCLSRTYLFLFHIGLLDYKLRYSQSIRDNLYSEVKENIPDIVKKYDIRFSDKKSKYYKEFALENYENCITPLLLINNHNSQLGHKYSFNIMYDHITSSGGFEVFEKLNDKVGYGYVAKIHVGFSNFDKKIHLNNKHNFEKFITLSIDNYVNKYISKKINYRDNNGNKITDKSIIEIIDAEEKFLNLI